MNNKITITYLSILLALAVFSIGTSNAAARETLSVQIVTPSSTVIQAGDQLQLTAQATGGPGGYNYQWYINDTAAEGATTTTYIFNPTQTGIFSLKCTATDATGIIPDQAISQALNITVTARAIAAGGAPQAANPIGETNTENQPLETTFIVAAVLIVIAVVAIAIFVVRKQRSHKQISQTGAENEVPKENKP